MTSAEITLKIDKAIAAHGMWKMRLKNAIKTHTSEFEISFVKSPNNCEFGKWLINDKATLGRYPEYNQIVQLHKDLHVETARIMQLALSARDKEAATAIVVGSKFASLSSKLTISMMNWKRAIGIAS